VAAGRCSRGLDRRLAIRNATVLEDFHAQTDALVADVNLRTGNEFQYPRSRFAAERTHKLRYVGRLRRYKPLQCSPETFAEAFNLVFVGHVALVGLTPIRQTRPISELAHVTTITAH
jgi:hypothetical protein